MLLSKSSTLFSNLSSNELIWFHALTQQQEKNTCFKLSIDFYCTDMNKNLFKYVRIFTFNYLQSFLIIVIEQTILKICDSPPI